MKTHSLSQYDAIAEAYYKSTLERDDRKYVLDPTFEYYLGRKNLLSGASVLDLGCGSGYYSRLLAKKGLRVVGADNSAKEIEIAQRLEDQEPLGITYHVYDAVNLPVVGQFDLVLALFLLHYCRTKQELVTMCRGIYENLAPGGRLLAFNNNPLRPVQDCIENYAYSVKGPQPLREGDVLTVTIKQKDGQLFSFDHYYWSKETYMEALQAAGFKIRNIAWRSLVVSPEAAHRFPKGFWDEYVANSNPIVLECIK